MDFNSLNSNNQKFIQVMNYDISQIFHCLTDVKITKQITPFKNFFIVLKENPLNAPLTLKKNVVFHYVPFGNISLIGRIQKIINESNYKCIIIKIIAVNKFLLSYEYKYYIYSEFFKTANNKVVVINKILTNRKNIDFSIFFDTFKKYLKVVENFIEKELKVYQYESIMINKNLNDIFLYLLSTNMFNKKNYKVNKIINNQDNIEIYFSNNKSKNKILICKVSDYHSYVLYVKSSKKKILEVSEYEESSKFLTYFLKKLRNLIEN